VNRLSFKRLPLDEVDWRALDRYPDRTVFQTSAWLAFIAETQGGDPVVAEVSEDGEPVGYFTGLTMNKFGLRILGSSFPGWTTPYIGFNQARPIDGRQLLAGLKMFAFGELGCVHFEVSCRGLDVDAARSEGYEVGAFETLESDLRPAEDQILGNMIKSCRYSIRKAEKSGVVIEETQDPGFADEYLDQLRTVFAKQRLVPTYGIERVHALMRHVGPTGNLLLLRARNPERQCIATGLYVGFNRIAEFWGNASYPWGQALCPNEALHWYAMRYWKRRGADMFDWGGMAKYKLKYGGSPSSVPWLKCSRYRWVGTVRSGAKALFDMRQRALGRLRNQRTEGDTLESE
jgi:hypothetical protein